MFSVIKRKITPCFSKEIIHHKDTEEIQLSDYIYTSSEAGEAERKCYFEYLNKGWKVLNEPSSLGALGGGIEKYKKETISELIEFSKEQLNIINAPLDENLLVLASPGSGKSSVIVERVKRLIDEGYIPRVISFNTQDAKKISKNLPGKIKSLIFQKEAERLLGESGGSIREVTERILDKSLEVDFKKTVYIVDEYQEITDEQYDFLSTLNSFGVTIFVAGDPNQAIYGYRGGNVKYISSFEEDFDAKKIELNINYRSSPEIVDFSNHLISGGSKDVFKNKAQINEKSIGSAPLHLEFKTHKDEAFFVFKSFQNWVKLGYDPSEFAVIARVKSVLNELPNLITMFMESEDYCKESSFDFNFFKSLNRMTVNSSRGMRFEAVIILGCEEGFFPNYKISGRGSVNEELRMLYVSVTRAKSHLLLTSAGVRYIDSTPGLLRQFESRFLKDIPEIILKKNGYNDLNGLASINIGDRFLYNGKKSFVKRLWGDNALCFVSGTGGLLIKQSVISEILKNSDNPPLPSSKEEINIGL